MDVKSFLLLNSDEAECARLREKWNFERKLKEEPPKETAKMSTATSTWLEQEIEQRLSDRRIARDRKAQADKDAETTRINEANKGLRLALGDSWLQRVTTTIRVGEAKFHVKGIEYTVTKTGENFTLNGVALAGGPLNNAILERLTDSAEF